MRHLEGISPLKLFEAGPEWKQYTFSLSDFDSDGSDITSLALVSTTPGKFEFEIDEVQIR
jgi:hypothetical protein